MQRKYLNALLSTLLVCSFVFFYHSLSYVDLDDLDDVQPAPARLAETVPVEEPEPAEPVVIGWCPDPYEHLSWGHPNVSKAIGEAMFPNRPVEIREMSSQGTPLNGTGWPDILMCIGHNYNKTVLDTRWEGIERFKPSPPAQAWTDDVYWPKRVEYPPHRDRPFLVAVNHEAWGKGPCKKYDVMWDTKTEVMHHGCPSIYYPYAAYSILERKLTTPQDLILPPDYDARAVMETKTKFCIFLQSTCTHKKYTHKDVAIRVAFFDALSEHYKQCDSLGYCRNTGERPKTYDGIKAGGMDESYLTYLPYKFVIASENRQMEHYFTEKMTGALLAKSVPIYFGDPFITKTINEDRIFVLNKYIPQVKLETLRKSKLDEEPLIQYTRQLFQEDFKQAIAVIKELDTNDEAFLNVLREPVFHGNTMEGTAFHLPTLGRKMRTVLKHYQSYLLD